jgi:hypothetical protein
VSDAAGRTIGVGTGLVAEPHPDRIGCRYSFTVPNLPASEPFYSVAVGAWKRTVANADLAANGWKIAETIGTEAQARADWELDATRFCLRMKAATNSAQPCDLTPPHGDWPDR